MKKDNTFLKKQLQVNGAQTVMESSAAAIALAKKAVAKVNGERESFCSTILFVVWR